jgi:hypothetical protein
MKEGMEVNVNLNWFGWIMFFWAGIAFLGLSELRGIQKAIREHTTTVLVTNTVTPVEIRTERNIYQPPEQPEWTVPPQWNMPITNWTWPQTSGVWIITTPCVGVSGKE